MNNSFDQVATTLGVGLVPDGDFDRLAVRLACAHIPLLSLLNQLRQR